MQEKSEMSAVLKGNIKASSTSCRCETAFMCHELMPDAGDFMPAFFIPSIVIVPIACLPHPYEFPNLRPSPKLWGT